MAESVKNDSALVVVAIILFVGVPLWISTTSVEKVSLQQVSLTEEKVVITLIYLNTDRIMYCWKCDLTVD